MLKKFVKIFWLCAYVIYEWSPRVLCSTNDCAICRQDMPQIVFSSKVAKFKDLADRVLPRDKRYQICFEDDSLKKSFEELLMHICPICPNKPIFRTFKQLDTHVRREHERFYCELCTTDLKVNTRAVLNFSLFKCHIETSPKGFLASKCDVGNWIFSKS